MTSSNSSFILRVTLIFVVVGFALVYVGCKRDDEPSAHERITSILTSAEAWTDPEVTVDGVDYSELYTSFEISFATSTYSTVEGDPVWQSSGSWRFLNEEGTRLQMDGTREVELNLPTADIIELSFQWDESTFEPGRVNSIKGKQKVKLKKKPK